MEKRYDIPEKACASYYIAFTTCRQTQLHTHTSAHTYTHASALLGCHCHTSAGKLLKEKKGATNCA